MPSIKMKNCLRENNGLHVCQKSSKISKNSFSNSRNVQHESELDTCCSNKQERNVTDSSNSCEMDHTETIFSPILESIDIEPNIYGYADHDIDDNTRKLCEYQNYNVTDLFIPDMIVSSSCLLDYNIGDEYMLLPFLEDSIDTEKRYEDCEPVIHNLKSCNGESDVNSYPDWDPAECLDSQMFIRNLLDFSGPSILPQKLETKSITLALDLDETLVHSSLEHCDNADFTFPVVSSFKQHTVYVKQRPYLRAFLEKVSEMFHIVIFTASQSIYAKQLLDILDPEGNIFSGRAYRESCIFVDGGYTKDLTVLGVDLAKIVIIDNSPQVECPVFRLQVNNGIPINSWFDDPTDCALISLLPFLETLVDAEDVRPIIAKRFGNKE